MFFFFLAGSPFEFALVSAQNLINVFPSCFRIFMLPKLFGPQSKSEPAARAVGYVCMCGTF